MKLNLHYRLQDTLVSAFQECESAKSFKVPFLMTPKLKKILGASYTKRTKPCDPVKSLHNEAYFVVKLNNQADVYHEVSIYTQNALFIKRKVKVILVVRKLSGDARFQIEAYEANEFYEEVKRLNMDVKIQQKQQTTYLPILFSRNSNRQQRRISMQPA